MNDESLVPSESFVCEIALLYTGNGLTTQLLVLGTYCTDSDIYIVSLSSDKCTHCNDIKCGKSRTKTNPLYVLCFSVSSSAFLSGVHSCTTKMFKKSKIADQTAAGQGGE